MITMGFSQVKRLAPHVIIVGVEPSECASLTAGARDSMQSQSLSLRFLVEHDDRFVETGSRHTDRTKPFETAAAGWLRSLSLRSVGGRQAGDGALHGYASRRPRRCDRQTHLLQRHFRFKNATFCAICTLMNTSFYQDRIGTNVTESSKRGAF
jgi:hypothetical protein